MIKCPNCGGELKFDPGCGMVLCIHCSSEFDPLQLKATEKHASEHDSFEGKSYNCSQCGATLLTFNETAVTFCSYCDSQAMIESKMITQNNPDFIIPFSKTKEECIKNYKAKVSKLLFVPNYMKQDMTVEKFRGIYMPYAIYKVTSNGISENNGSKYSHRSGDYVIYDEYSISSEVDAVYDGISYDLLSKYYDSYSEAIPFDFKQAKEFNSNYLIGFYADTKDVDSSIYNSYICGMVGSNSTHYLLKRKEFKKYGCTNPKANFHVEDVKVGMFPVYFLSIKNKDNKHINYAVVNGQTGDVVMELPIDFKKYVLFSILLTIPIYLLLMILPVITPKVICVFAIVCSLISIIISFKQLKNLEIHENYLDDKGYLVKNGLEYKSIKKKSNKDIISLISLIVFLSIFVIFSLSIGGFGIVISIVMIMVFIPIINKILNKDRNSDIDKDKDKNTDNNKENRGIFRQIYKQIVSIILPILVLILNPVDDMYYYICVFVSFILILLSFYNLVKQHNELVSRKLPQLEKRGGDLNE